MPDIRINKLASRASSLSDKLLASAKIKQIRTIYTARACAGVTVFIVSYSYLKPYILTHVLLFSKCENKNSTQ